MNFFKKIIERENAKFTYIVDLEVLKWYLDDQLSFSIDNNLELSASLFIYINGEKHHIQILNFSASDFKDEQRKGIVCYFDKKEYSSLDDLISNELNNLPKYFKIRLEYADDVRLNEYKKNHPELRIEDY